VDKTGPGDNEDILIARGEPTEGSEFPWGSKIGLVRWPSDEEGRRRHCRMNLQPRKDFGAYLFPAWGTVKFGRWLVVSS